MTQTRKNWQWSTDWYPTIHHQLIEIFSCFAFLLPAYVAYITGLPSVAILAIGVAGLSTAHVLVNYRWVHLIDYGFAISFVVTGLYLLTAGLLHNGLTVFFWLSVLCAAAASISYANFKKQTGWSLFFTSWHIFGALAASFAIMSMSNLLNIETDTAQFIINLKHLLP